jgi:hypothetical protein
MTTIETTLMKRVLSAALLNAAIAGVASAQQAKEPLAVQWGLIGVWSRDCGAPPAVGNGRLAYKLGSDGNVTLDRDFTEMKDSARISDVKALSDGNLEFVATYEAVQRRVIVSKVPGGMREVESQQLTGSKRFEVRDGVGTLSGKPTQPTLRCK